MSKLIVKKIIDSGSNINHRFIKDHNELKNIVETLKNMGYRIVLTQGVYDLIHEGHAAYLEVAKSEGDILIVGVDSDELTKKRKGPDRPIVPQDERIKMLVHLRHVDIVTIKEIHHGIGDLIKLLKPDVMVFSKSTKDIDSKMIKEYKDFCGKILVLPPQSKNTTTARIRNLAIDGAEKLAREMNRLTDGFLDKLRNSK